MRASNVVRQRFEEWGQEIGPAERSLIERLEVKEKRKKRIPPHSKPCNVCMGSGLVSVALQSISGNINMRAR